MVAKTYWLAGSALALLVAAAPAMAADLPVAPVYKAPPPMIAPLNWTGFYLGAGSGFAVFNADTSVQNPAGAPLFATSTQGGKGWLATGYVGYDYALSDHIVAGVLGDFDFGSVTGGYLDPATGGTGTMKEKYSWAAGGRLGWLVFPEFLAYVSGGLYPSALYRLQPEQRNDAGGAQLQRLVRQHRRRHDVPAAG
jgi:outer membrane immunogenic protein